MYSNLSNKLMTNPFKTSQSEDKIKAYIYLLNIYNADGDFVPAVYNFSSI